MSAGLLDGWRRSDNEAFRAGVAQAFGVYEVDWR